MEQLLLFLQPIIEMAAAALAGKYGSAIQVFSVIAMVMGVLRSWIKPLVSMAQSYVNITPDISDDEKLAKILDSKIYKSIAYFLDWFASLKLPKK